MILIHARIRHLILTPGAFPAQVTIRKTLKQGSNFGRRRWHALLNYAAKGINRSIENGWTISLQLEAISLDLLVELLLQLSLQDKPFLGTNVLAIF